MKNRALFLFDFFLFANCVVTVGANSISSQTGFVKDLLELMESIKLYIQMQFPPTSKSDKARHVDFLFLLLRRCVTS